MTLTIFYNFRFCWRCISI